MRKSSMVVVAVALAAAATACGSSSTKTAATPSSAGAASSGTSVASGTTVMIKNFAFDPTPLDVAVGTTVVWTNEDSVAHTVTATDKSFDSKDLNNGKSFSMKFTKAGTYSYICTIHQYMQGTIVVK